VLDGEGHGAINDEIHRIPEIRGNPGRGLAALFHLNSSDCQTAYTFFQKQFRKSRAGEDVARVLVENGFVRPRINEVH